MCGCDGLGITESTDLTLPGNDCLTLGHIFMNIIIQGVVVLKELLFNSFYFGRVLASGKNRILTVSTLGQCGGLEKTDF